MNSKSKLRKIYESATGVLASLRKSSSHLHEKERRRLKGSGRGFSFWYDHEVRIFIESCYGTATLSQITKMTHSRFGADRAPSRSAIHRYYQWLEKQEAA